MFQFSQIEFETVPKRKVKIRDRNPDCNCSGCFLSRPQKKGKRREKIEKALFLDYIQGKGLSVTA